MTQRISLLTFAPFYFHYTISQPSTKIYFATGEGLYLQPFMSASMLTTGKMSRIL